MDRLIKILLFIHRFGLLGVITLFIPVYWAQDCRMKNNGYDTWSFSQGKHSYKRSTYWDKSY